VETVNEPRQRTAAVTGASSGLGRAIAIGFGQLGWTVVIGARRLGRLQETAAAVESAGGRAIPLSLDVREPDSVQRFFDQAAEEAPDLDLLVNNAGITHIGAVADTDARSVHDVIGTNLIGAFLASARFLHDLRARGAGGDIIFISSSAAQQPWPYQVLYGAAKTGLDALARGLQLELEGTGIRSTIVRVGPVESEIGADLDSSLAMDVVAEWQRFGVLRNFAFLPAEEVARTVALVASAPPEIFLREVHVDSMPPAEALTQEQIDAAIGRGER
jgi:NAD(P)-dependent dehydrogenase (short-subunit alcohol dehydrogenase family)